MRSAKILIIDDNPSDVDFLRLALNDQGEAFDLEVLSDGEQALEFVRNQRETGLETHPRVIVLDLHLPKHDGLEILHALRHEAVLNHIGVVVLTGGASRWEKEEIRRLGGYCRSKPSQLSAFAELAAEVIAICKGLQATAYTPPMEVFTAETREILRRFSDGRIGYRACVAALDAAVARFLPTMHPNDAEEFQSVLLANSRILEELRQVRAAGDQTVN